MIRINRNIWGFLNIACWSHNRPYCFVFGGGHRSFIIARNCCMPFSSHFGSYWLSWSTSSNWSRRIK